MRPHLLLTAVAAGLLAAPAPAAAACITPAGARVVAQTEEASVTLETQGEDADPLEGETSFSLWRGCAEESATQVELLSGSRALFSSRSASGFELAGPLVAFLAERAPDKYESFARLVTVDLRTGARWESGEVSYFGGLGFTEHAVNRRGDAAWVRLTYGERRQRQWRLFVRNDGRVVRRDTSSRPLSRLRLSGTRMSWSEGGRRRSRRLG